MKCSIVLALNTDFDKGNQEIEITSFADFSSVLLFWSATDVRYSKYLDAQMGVSHKKRKMKKRHEMINFMTINHTLALKKDQFISDIKVNRP